MIRLQRLLFGVAAAFWLVAGALLAAGLLDFGRSSGARLARSGNGYIAAEEALGFLMLANGAALALAGWFSSRGHHLVDYGALALAALNAILSLTDEIGLLDALSLLVSSALVALLIANMRRQKAAQSH